MTRLELARKAYARVRREGNLAPDDDDPASPPQPQNNPEEAQTAPPSVARPTRLGCDQSDQSDQSPGPAIFPRKSGFFAEPPGRDQSPPDCDQSPPVLVTAAADLATVAAAVDGSVLVGLDVETTSLDPRQGRVRLLSLATSRGVFLLDSFTLDPGPLWPHLAARPIVGHNLSF